MSKIFNCQANLKTLLTADAFFTDADPTKSVPVLTQRVGDIPTAIAQALQKIAVGVVVMLPLVTFLENDTPALCVGLKFAIAVTENPLLNKTGKPAEAIVEQVLKLTHWKQNGVGPGDSMVSLFLVDRNAVRQLTPPANKPQILAYHINVNTTINL